RRVGFAATRLAAAFLAPLFLFFMVVVVFFMVVVARPSLESINSHPARSDRHRHEPADRPMAATMHGFMAIKRHIHTNEIADYAAFLASPSAAMITGLTQTIDGGFGV